MHIDLKALAAVRAVFEEGTVTAAARRLHRSQPVVSRTLSQFEGRLGFALFHRERHRLTPTAAGIAFFRESERAFGALAEIEAVARQLRNGVSAPLRVVAPSHIVHGLLPEALASVASRHADFRFSVEIRQREYISHWVRNRQFDLGILPDAQGAAGVTIRPMARVPLCAVLAASDPRARRTRFRVTDLAGAAIVAVRAGTPMRGLMDRTFSAHRIRPEVRGEAASVLAACQIAASGIGIALADPFTASLLRNFPGAAIRPLSPRVEIEYHFVTPSSDAVTPAALDLMEVLRARASAIAASAAQRNPPPATPTR